MCVLYTVAFLCVCDAQEKERACGFTLSAARMCTLWMIVDSQAASACADAGCRGWTIGVSDVQGMPPALLCSSRLSLPERTVLVSGLWSFGRASSSGEPRGCHAPSLQPGGGGGNYQPAAKTYSERRPPYCPTVHQVYVSQHGIHVRGLSARECGPQGLFVARGRDNGHATNCALWLSKVPGRPTWRLVLAARLHWGCSGKSFMAWYTH